MDRPDPRHQERTVVQMLGRDGYEKQNKEAEAFCDGEQAHRPGFNRQRITHATCTTYVSHTFMRNLKVGQCMSG